LINIGATYTNINILENGVLKVSHTFNVAGNEITDNLSQSLKINYEQAEELKKEIGLENMDDSKKSIHSVLYPLVNLIFVEIDKVCQDFYYKTNKKIEKIFLAGGCSFLPGLKEYIAKESGLEVEIVNCFSNISYPPILEEVLMEMSPIYAVAVGLAKNGLQ